MSQLLSLYKSCKRQPASPRRQRTAIMSISITHR